MFKPEAVYPEYLMDPNVLLCPADKKVSTTDPVALLDDHSYFYLGFATTKEEEGMAFIEAYRAAAKEGKPLTTDLEVPKEVLPQEKIFRLREGVERFFITDINDPAASAKTQSSIPVIVERPGHHSPDGGNVLYMDGHVEFLKYPSQYPMTERFIKGLEELDKLSDLPPTPEAKAPEPEQQQSPGPFGLARSRGIAGARRAVETAGGSLGRGGVKPKVPTELDRILDSPVTIEFENVHVSEITEFISDSYGINIVLDSRVIVPPKPAKPIGAPGADASGTGEDPANSPFAVYVTDGRVPYINLKDIPLRDALTAVLTSLSLDFKVEPNYVFVSTPEVLDGKEPSRQQLPAIRPTTKPATSSSGQPTEAPPKVRPPGAM
jgi:prepilin-type processing-associated H-X9-DG protein